MKTNKLMVEVITSLEILRRFYELAGNKEEAKKILEIMKKLK